MTSFWIMGVEAIVICIFAGLAIHLRSERDVIRSERNAERDAVRSERATLRTENEELRSKLSASETKLAISEDAKARLETENEKLRAAAAKADDTLAEVKRLYSDEAAQHAVLQTRHKQLRSENTRWTNLVEALAERIDSNESARARLKAMKALIDGLFRP